ncbi:hypothetical protein BX666DRAFT_1926208 [Dichotomocladium elegans]|nr:hypothetical protein BX666DRAFT_1926208 [Dichotomocladium elegans]
MPPFLPLFYCDSDFFQKKKKLQARGRTSVICRAPNALHHVILRPPPPTHSGSIIFFHSYVSKGKGA